MPYIDVDGTGLAVTTDRAGLGRYFRDQVIGGPDAFVVTAQEYEDFVRAIRVKLLREIGFATHLQHLLALRDSAGEVQALPVKRSQAYLDVGDTEVAREIYGPAARYVERPDPAGVPFGVHPFEVGLPADDVVDLEQLDATGDLGVSYRHGRPVAALFAERLPATALPASIPVYPVTQNWTELATLELD